jgi:hypothetical protein
MFDHQWPGLHDLPSADDSVLAAAIGGWAQVEAAAAARRLAAIGELVARRVRGGPAERGRWSCDNWDAVAAEVAAALNVTHGTASGQMYLATALRERLPQVAALLADGEISYALARTIAWHTDLIEDPEALRLVDKTLADDAVRFGPLSAAKTAQAIEAIVERYDPGAVRQTRAQARSRDLVIDTANSESGTTALWGRLFATDAALLDRRLLQLAHGVCDEDPRTRAQRRADALGALAAGADRLACGCAHPDCPARDAAPASAVLIQVVADAATVDTPPDPQLCGEAELQPRDPEPDPPGGWAAKPPPAVLTTGAVIPPALLAELIRAGATLQPVGHPGDTTGPEPGYRPSARLARFIRCRDLTCRFPGCDRPAQFCDIDHTVPYPYGPTHPSNLKCPGARGIRAHVRGRRVDRSAGGGPRHACAKNIICSDD